ncbi:hypothetical protein DFH05DRAFT_1491025 [Lentinula detonsa]|uniref:Uncharacterized protein n=1 Tax=Lentinula detonsa TaxID=2804962 RepID=A0A9W8P107_9AGAR|nr:hypothetical protein DFH05DRAFT_1491025 [Lentinula detonsa]
MAQMISTLLAATFAIFLHVVQVHALDSASCSASSSFDWSYNSLSQDPCTVATYLGAVCNNGQYTIPAINSTEFYSGPTSATQNECRCSSVFYSLLMACAQCQEASITTWTSYAQNCSTVYVGVFPDNVPSGTAVPHWATLTSAEFNATAAEAAGDSPELIGATQTTSSNTPSSPATSTSSPSSSSPSGAASSSKSNTGAIAGGVVGGVVGLALIAAILFWYLRKRSRAKSTVPASGIDRDFNLSPDMTGTTHAPTVIPFQQKLYDPSDPSTYPTNVMSSSHGQNYHHGSSVNDFGGSSVFRHSPNASLNATQHTYPGFAEI